MVEENGDKCKTCIHNYKPPCEEPRCNALCAHYEDYDEGFGNYLWADVCINCEKASYCEKLHQTLPSAEAKPCKYCESGSNDFTPLNADTSDYSGVELAINRQGMLRARSSDRCHDVVLIRYCPFCGKEFKRW